MREESSHICLEGKINSKKFSIIQIDTFGILTKTVIFLLYREMLQPICLFALSKGDFVNLLL